MDTRELIERARRVAAELCARAAELEAGLATETTDSAGPCSACGCSWHRCRANQADDEEPMSCCHFCSHAFTGKERAAFRARAPRRPELEIVTEQPAAYPF